MLSSSPPEDAEPDGNQVIEIGDSDEDDASSQSQGHINLLDDEASERSGLHSDGSPSSDEEVTDPFPFNHLPPELRLRVWQMFCPDLLGEPRVLDFSIQPALLSHYPAQVPKDNELYTVYDGRCLDDQTLELRRVMAVNRESRSFALDVYPHQLGVDIISGGAVIWFNQELDVIMLDNVDSLTEGANGANFILPQFADQVVNLAVPLNDFSGEAVQMAPLESWLDGFPSLKRLFLHAGDGNCFGTELKDKQIQWCASENVCRYTIETFEKEPGYGENDRIIVAWPDLLRHATFAKVHVPKWHRKLPTETQEYLEECGIETWPMVLFDNVIGLERIEKLLEHQVVPLNLATNGEDESSEESSADGDFESEPDVYESEGIDDDSNPETFSESGEAHLDDGDQGDTGRFSSPEGSPEENRGRKRRIVADSEDEDAEEGDVAPKAKRARKAIVLESDEEENEEQEEYNETQTQGSRVNGQSEGQIVVSDDSDDEPVTNQMRGKASRRAVEESESEDDEPRRITLTERLQMRRSRHDVESEESEEDDEDEGEEDEDDEEEDEDGARVGLIDDMAMESDGDKEEADEEDDDE